MPAPAGRCLLKTEGWQLISLQYFLTGVFPHFINHCHLHKIYDRGLPKLWVLILSFMFLSHLSPSADTKILSSRKPSARHELLHRYERLFPDVHKMAGELNWQLEKNSNFNISYHLVLPL